LAIGLMMPWQDNVEEWMKKHTETSAAVIMDGLQKDFRCVK